jgi:UDP:flavonoid glycosyltransferase YjiC (YdhE family)
VRRLTAERLAAGIEEGMLNLRQYTAAAEALAVEMAGEDGVAAAAKAIEAELVGA